MTQGAIFRVVSSRGVMATVTLTVMATATYTEARCPSCNRLVMMVPGCIVETRSRPTRAMWAGRGPVVRCERCGDYVEVLTHP